jgi:hypothetical protein
MNDMSQRDDFGRDPAVQAMRRTFSAMENAQQKLLEAVALPRLDRRLRVWRDQALRLFEQAWGRAQSRGLVGSEEDVTTLYLICLACILERGRVSLPAGAAPQNQKLEEVVRESLK